MSQMEKTIIFISPCQKFGMDTPRSAVTMLISSIKEYWRVAEIMPVGIPRPTANSILTSASNNVVGKRANISDETG